MTTDPIDINKIKEERVKARQAANRPTLPNIGASDPAEDQSIRPAVKPESTLPIDVTPPATPPLPVIENEVGKAIETDIEEAEQFEKDSVSAFTPPVPITPTAPRTTGEAAQRRRDLEKKAEDVRGRIGQVKREREIIEERVGAIRSTTDLTKENLETRSEQINTLVDDLAQRSADLERLKGTFDPTDPNQLTELNRRIEEVNQEREILLEDIEILQKDVEEFNQVEERVDNLLESTESQVIFERAERTQDIAESVRSEIDAFNDAIETLTGIPNVGAGDDVDLPTIQISPDVLSLEELNIKRAELGLGSTDLAGEGLGDAGRTVLSVPQGQAISEANQRIQQVETFREFKTVVESRANETGVNISDKEIREAFFDIQIQARPPASEDVEKIVSAKETSESDTVLDIETDSEIPRFLRFITEAQVEEARIGSEAGSQLARVFEDVGTGTSTGALQLSEAIKEVLLNQNVEPIRKLSETAPELGLNPETLRQFTPQDAIDLQNEIRSKYLNRINQLDNIILDPTKLPEEKNAAIGELQEINSEITEIFNRRFKTTLSTEGAIASLALPIGITIASFVQPTAIITRATARQAARLGRVVTSNVKIPSAQTLTKTLEPFMPAARTRLAPNPVLDDPILINVNELLTEQAIKQINQSRIQRAINILNKSKDKIQETVKPRTNIRLKTDEVPKRTPELGQQGKSPIGEVPQGDPRFSINDLYSQTAEANIQAALARINAARATTVGEIASKTEVTQQLGALLALSQGFKSEASDAELNRLISNALDTGIDSNLVVRASLTAAENSINLQPDLETTTIPEVSSSTSVLPIEITRLEIEPFIKNAEELETNLEPVQNLSIETKPFEATELVIEPFSQIQSEIQTTAQPTTQTQIQPETSPETSPAPAPSPTQTPTPTITTTPTTPTTTPTTTPVLPATQPILPTSPISPRPTVGPLRVIIHNEDKFNQLRSNRNHLSPTQVKVVRTVFDKNEVDLVKWEIFDGKTRVAEYGPFTTRGALFNSEKLSDTGQTYLSNQFRQKGRFVSKGRDLVLTLLTSGHKLEDIEGSLPLVVPVTGKYLSNPIAELNDSVLENYYNGSLGVGSLDLVSNSSKPKRRRTVSKLFTERPRIKSRIQV